MNTPFEEFERIFEAKKEISSKELFTLFDAVHVPEGGCWRTIYRIIFDTAIDIDSNPDGKIPREQLGPVMKMALELVKEKDFTEPGLLNLIKAYSTVSHAVCHNQILDILNELNEVTREFRAMSVKSQEKVRDLASETISAVESELSVEDKVNLIKSKFKETISLFREDLVRLDQISHTDHLTGLFNRRFFDEQLSMEVSLALKEKTWLNLLMIDIDDFKLFNDTYGHLIGDQALKTVAKNIRLGCRDKSGKTGIEFFPTRYGGEEFAVILPAIDEMEAFHVAESIQTKIGNYTFIIRNKKGIIKHENLKLTVSIGVAALRHTYHKKQAVTALVQDADTAMFEAKKAGKNCIIISTGHEA